MKEVANDFTLPPDAKRALDKELGRQVDCGSEVFPQSLTLEEFLEKEIPTPPQLVQGLFHQGSKVVIGGGSKSYKTWMLSDLGISVAAGAPWIGFETIQGKVLYANLEIQPFAYQKRLQDIIMAKELTSKISWMKNFHLVNLRGYCSNTKGLLQELQSMGNSFSIIIIDPLYKLLAGRVENSAEAMNELFNELEQLAEGTGAAVVLGNHFSKGNQAAKESIDRISGSGVFARDPDSIITVTPHEEKGAFAIECTLRNLAPVDPFVVRWDPPLLKRAGSLDPEKLKKPRSGPEKQFKPEMIARILGDGNLSKPELVKAAKEEYGMSSSVAYNLIAEAENIGLIKRNEGVYSSSPRVTEISGVARGL